MVPITIVQTIWEELNYGASNLLAPSSTAITDIPEKNSVRYKKILLSNILAFSRFILTPALPLLLPVLAFLLVSCFSASRLLFLLFRFFLDAFHVFPDFYFVAVARRTVKFLAV